MKKLIDNPETLEIIEHFQDQGGWPIYISDKKWKMLGPIKSCFKQVKPRRGEEKRAGVLIEKKKSFPVELLVHYYKLLWEEQKEYSDQLYTAIDKFREDTNRF